MNIALMKIDLVKKILNTDSEEIIRYLYSIIENQSENWLSELPEEIKKSVDIGLSQSDEGVGIEHDNYFKKYLRDDS